MTSQKSRRAGRGGRRKPRPGANDGVIYLAFVVLGVLMTVMGLLVFDAWREVLVGYVGAMGYLINLYAFRAYQGIAIPGWQESLARIPLRFAGYGGRNGRPIEAAQGADTVRTTVLISTALSVVIVIIVGAVLLSGAA